MLTVYSEDHVLQDGKVELVDGQLLPCFEMPRRAFLIRDRVREVGLGRSCRRETFERGPLERVHAPDFVEFLATAWERWTATAAPTTRCPGPGRPAHLRQVRPERIDGQMGFYSFDAGTPITAGTWRAAAVQREVALTGGQAAWPRAPRRRCSRCAARRATTPRPTSMAATASSTTPPSPRSTCVDGGAERVAILDVDYHHGNGTQAIFYDRPDVLFVSLHGDPREEYPFFLGWADESGDGAGRGLQRQLSRCPGAPASTRWAEALEDACGKIAAYAPDVLLVSLGVDTYEDDPISKFKLRSQDFTTYGARLARLDLPTLFVMEGGYAVEQIGINAVNVLQGFEGD